MLTSSSALCYGAPMTLKDVLQPYGITTASELARKVGMSRQQASELWNEKAGIGKRVAKRITAATGCPFHVLMLYRDGDGDISGVTMQASGEKRGR